MDMKVYVSCYIPSMKQTVMRIIYIHPKSTILEARDQILQALGLGEKKNLIKSWIGKRRIFILWNSGI